MERGKDPQRVPLTHLLKKPDRGDAGLLLGRHRRGWGSPERRTEVEQDGYLSVFSSSCFCSASLTAEPRQRFEEQLLEGAPPGMPTASGSSMYLPTACASIRRAQVAPWGVTRHWQGRGRSLKASSRRHKL